MRLFAFALVAVVIVSEIPKGEARSVTTGQDDSKKSKPEEPSLSVEKFNELANKTIPDYIPITRSTSRSITKDNCTPFQGYYDDCNYCVCPPPGFWNACTRMPCSKKTNDTNVNVKNTVDDSVKSKPEDASSDVEESTPVYLTGENCKSFNSFYEGCNLCLCTEPGYPLLCSNEPCPMGRNDDNVNGNWTVGDSRKPCAPGKTYKDDCNDCICGLDGLTAICTIDQCSPNTNNNNNNNVKVNSTVDDSVKSKAKDTSPDVEGYKKLIDQIFTGKTPFARSRDFLTIRYPNSCEPGEYFVSYCNECLCSYDGIHALCTKKLCQ